MTALNLFLEISYRRADRLMLCVLWVLFIAALRNAAQTRSTAVA